MNTTQKNYAVKRINGLYEKAKEAAKNELNRRLVELQTTYEQKLTNLLISKLTKGKFNLATFIEDIKKATEKKFAFLEKTTEEQTQQVKTSNMSWWITDRDVTHMRLNVWTPTFRFENLLPGYIASQKVLEDSFHKEAVDIIKETKEREAALLALKDQTIDAIMLGDDASQVIEMIEHFESEAQEFV